MSNERRPNLVFLRDLKRAQVPSHLYLFPPHPKVRGNTVIYGIPRGNSKYYFRFNKADWNFELEDSQDISLEGISQILDRQFELLQQRLWSFRPREGPAHREPLLPYTKIIVLKRGPYYNKPGIVVGNRGFTL